MSDWIKTSDNKKIKSLLDGKVMVVAPLDFSNIVPLFCPCCNFPMKDSNDSMSYRKNGVCNKCDDRWTNKPGIVWPDGPDKNSEDWKKYIEFRNLTEKPVFNFK